MDDGLEMVGAAGVVSAPLAVIATVKSSILQFAVFTLAVPVPP